MTAFVKKITAYASAFGAFALALLAGVNGAFAAAYTLPAADVTDIGTAAGDVADSIPGILGDLLPVMIGLLVVTFVVRFVMRMIRQ